MSALLEIDDLHVHYQTAAGEARAVDGVSFTLDAGDYLGLVGESGCGKSTIARAVTGILPESARSSGAIRFKGQNLLGMPDGDRRPLRWREIALVPQSAMNGFDPVYTVEQQLDEAITAHASLKPNERRRRVAELFDMVGIERQRVRDYPHQFSGGMRQRAMIAMAMVLDPPLIVADEPTTGLDVIVQDQIMQRLKEIQERYAKAILLITHDMAVVAENCNRIVVMYAGKVAEAGGEAVFQTPFHPYTLGLCNAFPDLDDRGRDLISIRGAPPSLLAPPSGCRFHQRCPFATAFCAERTPPLVEVAPGHVAACHYVDRAPEFRARAREPETWTRAVVQE